LKGNDVRQYRRLVGLNQIQFARRLGVTQSSLSRIEAGRIAVADEHVERLIRNFTGQEFKPSFADFQRQLEKEAERQQPALTIEAGRQFLLTVWRWEEGFDLSRIPNADLAVGTVAIPYTKNATIAFEMSRASEKWSKGEIIVFEECPFEDIRPDDPCLVQYVKKRLPITTIAIAELARTGVCLRSLISRGGPIPEDSLRLVMRATSRVARM